jgi:hypothetical protein
MMRRGTEFLAGGASGAVATHSFGRILRGGADARRGQARGGANRGTRGGANRGTRGGANARRERTRGGGGRFGEGGAA